MNVSLELEKAKSDFTLRFNPNHGSDGRFTTGGGSGGSGESVSSGGSSEISGGSAGGSGDYLSLSNQSNNLDKQIKDLTAKVYFSADGGSAEELKKLQTLQKQRNDLNDELINSKNEYFNNSESVEKREKVLRGLETDISKNNYETVYYVDANGNVISHNTGDDHSVKVNYDAIKDMIVTHNHPTDEKANSIGMLSPEDVNAFVMGDAFEMRAITSNKQFFSIKQDVKNSNLKK